MYKTSEIVEQYGITESRLKEYIIEQNIPVVNEEISKKYFQTVLSFIEKTEDRIEKKLKKAEATFKYNSEKNKVSSSCKSGMKKSISPKSRSLPILPSRSMHGSHLSCACACHDNKVRPVIIPMAQRVLDLEFILISLQL